MKDFAVRRSDRFAGAVFAILVQAGFLALLLFSRLPATPSQNLARELTLILPRLPQAQPPPAPPTPSRPLAAPPAPLLVTPQTPIVPPPTAAPEAAPNLGQALFGCAPENYANLSPEQRAHCDRPGDGVAVRDGPVLKELPTQAKDHDRWEAALAARKSIRLPCTNTENLHGTATAAAIVDPFCANAELLKMLRGD